MKKPPDISDEDFTSIEELATWRWGDDPVERDREMRAQIAALREIAFGAPHGVQHADFERVVRKMERLFGADFVARELHGTIELDALRERGNGSRAEAGLSRHMSRKPQDVSDADFALIHELAACLYQDDREVYGGEARRQLAALRALALDAPPDIHGDVHARIVRDAQRLFGADFVSIHDLVSSEIDALRLAQEHDAERHRSEVFDAGIARRGAARAEARPSYEHDEVVPRECPKCGAPIEASPAFGPILCSYCKERVSDIEACPDPDAHEAERASRGRVAYVQPTTNGVRQSRSGEAGGCTSAFVAWSFAFVLMTCCTCMWLPTLLEMVQAWTTSTYVPPDTSSTLAPVAPPPAASGEETPLPPPSEGPPDARSVLVASK